MKRRSHKKLPPPRTRLGVKPEPQNLLSICQGIVAGILSDHFLGRDQAAYEAALRPHLLAIAYKRRFGVYLEYPLQHQSKGGSAPTRRGAKKKIDAVLFYGRQVIAIEVKTIRPGSKFLDLDTDLKKLAEFKQLESKNLGMKRRITCWQIVAWDSNSIPTFDEGTKFVDKFLKLPPKKWSKQHTLPKRPGMRLSAMGSVGSFRAWCIAICVKPP